MSEDNHDLPPDDPAASATPPLDDAADPVRAALDRWNPAGPPAGFADRIVAIAAAEPLPGRRRPRPRWPVAVAGLAAAAVLAMFVWPASAPPPIAVATRTFASRETVALGGRGVAVVEPGTALGWHRDGQGLAVQQPSGDVFYRVDRAAGAPFVVTTPAGDVRVTGTCFRVEVQPMLPKASILGAAAGAVVATVAVVTVYEGKVLVASPAGKAEVKAGERVTLDGTAPMPTPDPGPGRGPRVAIAVPAEPSAAITRDELLIRDKAQREQIAALSTRLKELEGAVAGGRIKRPGGPPGLDEDFLNPSKEDLLAMAKQCGVKLDLPPVMRGEPMTISPDSAAEIGLTPEEVATANQVFVEVGKQWRARVRGWYIEATGDTAGGDQLSAHAMGEELQDKAAPGEPGLVQKRISHERAGLALAPPDLSRLSPFERYFRALADLGNEAERMLAAKLGPEKAHKLRAVNGGWGIRMQMAGCDGEDGEGGGDLGGPPPPPK